MKRVMVTTKRLSIYRDSLTFLFDYTILNLSLNKSKIALSYEALLDKVLIL